MSGASVLLVVAGACQLAHGGTLFGLQFRGDDTALFALPTEDPQAGPSPIGDPDVVPYHYPSAAQRIAIGSTGLRRFRKVSPSGMDAEGSVSSVERSTTLYYNFVPKMVTSSPSDNTAEAVRIDVQTGDVVVEEAVLGPLLSVQFSATGAIFGLFPEFAGGRSGGVQVKYFEPTVGARSKDASQQQWNERGHLSFPGMHAVFGLSAMDREKNIFYCVIYNPAQKYNVSSRLIGLQMPTLTREKSISLVVSTNVSMPLMFSSLSHEHKTGLLLGVAWDMEMCTHRLVKIDPAMNDTQLAVGKASASNSLGLGGRAQGHYDMLSPWLFTSALDHEKPLYYQMLHDSTVNGGAYPGDAADHTKPGSTVLSETDSASGNITFRQHLQPGFVDMYVLPAPAIARLEPKTGPFEGGTKITIKGDYMVKTARIGCKFDYTHGIAYPGDAGETVLYQGDLIVNWEQDDYLWSRDLIGLNESDLVGANFSSYDVVCRSPRRHDWFKLPEKGFYSKLNVSRDTIDFRVGVVSKEWSEHVPFQFYRQPIIKRIDPRYGPLSGNTTVTLFGQYFYDTGTILCSFGTIKGVPGNYDNLTRTVTCVSPNQTSTGAVSVEVALNGQQYTTDTVQFTYYEPAENVQILSSPATGECKGICPRSGPTTGGTTVIVTGQNFLETNETSCKFGAIEVPATFVRKTGQVVCISPKCCSDNEGRHRNAKVSFEIALNGQQYTAMGYQGWNFRFYDPPIVSSIKPLLGKFNSGKDVAIIQGQDIVETNEIKCKFGDLAIRGVRDDSENQVKCTAPVAPHAGPVKVRIALNGQQYTQTFISFSYTAVLYHIVPDKGVISGNTNVTVYGLGFHDMGKGRMFCRFAHGADSAHKAGENGGLCDQSKDDKCWSRAVVADFASQHAMHCLSPELNTTAAGNKRIYQVEVSIDGGIFYSVSARNTKLKLPTGYPYTRSRALSNLDKPPDSAEVLTKYQYYPAPRVTSISPITGPIKGTTAVIISGTGFINAGKGLHMCRFGAGVSAAVPAAFMSSTQVQCISPSVANSGGPQDVEVELTHNNQQYTSDHIKFTYYDPSKPPQVIKVVPGSGSKKGNTVLRVLGNNFKNSLGGTVPPLKCRFGSDKSIKVAGTDEFDGFLLAVHATFVSSQEIRCVTPGLTKETKGTIPKTVEVANEPKGYDTKNDPADGDANYWGIENYTVVNGQWKYVERTKYQYSENKVVFLYSSTSATLSKLIAEKTGEGVIKDSRVRAGQLGTFMIAAYNEQNQRQETGSDIFYVNGALRPDKADSAVLLKDRGMDPATLKSNADVKAAYILNVLELAEQQLIHRGPARAFRSTTGIWNNLNKAIPSSLGNLGTLPSEAATSTIQKCMDLLKSGLESLSLAALVKLPAPAASFTGEVIDLYTENKGKDEDGTPMGGYYRGNFTAVYAGWYNLRVTTAGTVIAGGQPVTLQVTYSDPYPPQWTVQGPGLGDVIAAEIKHFYIQMRDRYRNPIECCSRSIVNNNCLEKLKTACEGSAGHDVTYNKGTDPRLRISITMVKRRTVVDVDLRCKLKANCGNEIMYANDCSDIEQIKPKYDLRALKNGKPTSGPCGVFKVRYSTMTAGNYKVSIGVAQTPDANSKVEQILRSPYDVYVAPEPETDTVSSTAYGEGLSVTFAGDVSRFWVQAKDKYSNDRLQSGDEFYASFAFGDGDSTVKIKTLPPNQGCPSGSQSTDYWPYRDQNVVTNCDLKNSTYVFAYVATVAGTYQISVTREGEFIKNPINPGKPFVLVCLPSATNASRTTAGALQEASDLGTFQTITAGVAKNFTIQARDSYNNKRITGGDEVKANAWFLGNSRVVPKGLFSAISSYTCSDPSHNHHYNWNSATNTCDGPERWMDYTWQSQKAFALNSVVNATDENNGIYQIQYATTVTGYYHLDIYMLPLRAKSNYIQIPSAPFMIFVEPAPASPKNSFVFGDGLRTTDAAANITTIQEDSEQRWFTIVGVDKFGNQRKTGGDPFGATLTIAPFESFGSSSDGKEFTVDVDITDSKTFGGGKYNVTYKPTVAGTYSIAVFLGPIQNQMWDGGKGFKASAAQSILGGMCFENCFTKKTDGKGVITFTYNVEKYSNVTAKRVASVRLLPAAIAASRCVAAGGGIVGPVIAGGGAHFDIQARDKWGNDRTVGGDNFIVVAQTKQEHAICKTYANGKCASQYSGKVTLSGAVIDNDKLGRGGTYTVYYNATVSGNYDVSVSLKQREKEHDINKSPFAPVVLSAVTHGPSCTVAQVPQSTKAGDKSEFIIVARDRFGNQREGSQHDKHPTKQEGDKFAVVLVTASRIYATVTPKYWNRFVDESAPKGSDCAFQPPNFNAPYGDLVCDIGTGKYLVRYKPTVAGIYSITLKYDSTEFESSPKQTTVAPASLVIDGHKNSIAYGSGLYQGVSRKPATFTIQARDRFNNNATEGNEIFTVSISGKEYIYDCNDEASQQFTRKCTQIADSNNGFYAVTWYPQVVGDYKIRVRLQISATVQKDIKGSMTENDCHVDPDTTSAAQSAPCGILVSGTKQCRNADEIAGLRGGSAGKDIKFTVQARDGANNPQPAPGGDQFSVHMVCVSNCRVPNYVLNINPCQPVYTNNLPVFSNAMRACKNCVCDSLVEQTGPSGKITVGSGQYLVKYRSNVAGTYLMHIRLTRLAPTQGVAAAVVSNSIGNATCCKLNTPGCHKDTRPKPCSADPTYGASPYIVHIDPAAYHAPKCVAYGAGTENATAGKPATFIIQPKDQFGNNGTLKQKLSYSSPFSVTMRGTITQNGAVVPTDVYGFPDAKYEAKPVVTSPTSASVYEVVYKISQAGIYKMVIVLTDPDPGKIDDFTGEIQESKHFFVKVKPATASVARTRVASLTLPSVLCLQGIEVRQQQSSVENKDSSNDKQKQDPCPRSLSTETKADWYNTKGKTINIVTGVEAGLTANFTLFIYDIHDNARKAGGDAVTAELRALAGASINAELIVVTCNVIDNQDSSYSVSFAALRAHAYDAVLKLNGADVRDPPFKVQVVASVRDPAKCTTEGAGIVGGQHAKDLVFTIVVKDRFSNQIDKPSNDTFILTMQGKKDKDPKGPNDMSAVFVPVKLENLGLSSTNYGRYTATYRAPNLLYKSPSDQNPNGPNRVLTFPYGPWEYTMSIMVPGTDQSELRNQELRGIDSGDTVAIADWTIQDGKGSFGTVAGRSAVLRLAAGAQDSGYGHLWQTFKTAEGQRYRVRVNMFMSKETAEALQQDKDCAASSYFADNKFCVSQGVNMKLGCGCWGTGGVDVVDAVACGGNYVGTNTTGLCNYRHSTVAFVTPTKGELTSIELGSWATIQLIFVAPSAKSTIRLHFNGAGAYFHSAVVDTHIEGSPFRVLTTQSYEKSVARGTEERTGTTAAGSGLSGATAGSKTSFAITPRDPIGLRQDPTVEGWVNDYFNIKLGDKILGHTFPAAGGKEDRSFVEYSETVTGVYQLSIRLITTPKTANTAEVSEHIEGSPFQLKIVSSKADHEKSEASGSGLTSTVAGVEAQFQIQTKDKYGNVETDLPVVGIGDKVTAKLRHNNIEPAVTITRHANKTVWYTAKYTATWSGVYELRILLDANLIGKNQDPTSQVKVLSAPTHPASCIVEGSGVKGGIAGEPGDVHLYVKDRFGNLVSDEQRAFQIRMYCGAGRCGGVNGNNAGKILPTKEHTKDSTDQQDKITNELSQLDKINDGGHYRGFYYITVSGQYYLSLELGGGGNVFVGKQQKIYLTIVPTGFDHTRSEAYGPGLIEGRAGGLALFSVAAKDQYSNQLTSGGLIFSVQVRGPSFVLGTVEDSNDGIYRVSFEPKIRGEYRIQVRSRGKQIPCRNGVRGTNTRVYECAEDDQGVSTKDWRFKCTPAATFADKTFAYGTGLTYAVADSADYSFTIRAMDKFAVEQANGGEPERFRVAIKDAVIPPLDEFECKKQDPGIYSWNLARRACYKIIKNVTLGKESDNADGTYIAKYRVELAGQFMMHVTFSNNTVENAEQCESDTVKFSSYKCGDYDIRGSPFTLTVEAGPISPKDCVALGFDDLKVRAGFDTPFVIQTKDLFGNNGKYDVYGVSLPIWAQMQPCLKVGTDCSSRFKGCCPMNPTQQEAAEMLTFNLVVKNMLDGTYQAILLATVSGDYTVTVRVGGEQGIEIKDSPYYKAVVPGDSSVSDLAVGLVPSCYAGETVRLIARTRDKHGNWLVTGRQMVRAVFRTTVGEALSKRSVTKVLYQNSTDILDMGNGTYVAEFSLAVAGTYEVSVLLDGKKGFSGQLQVESAPATYGPACTAGGSGWTGAYWQRKSTFRVQARDQYGNKRPINTGDKFLLEFGESVRLNTTGSVVLVTKRTGAGRTVQVVSVGTGEHALQLFGDSSIATGTSSTSGRYVGNLLVPHDFTAVAEVLVISVDGETRDYKIDKNIKSAKDLSDFLMARFALLGIPAIATACPSDCNSYCKYCGDHGTKTVYPSDWSRQIMVAHDNSTQPIRGTFVGDGVFSMNYIGNSVRDDLPNRYLIIYVYHCLNPSDPNCDLRVNISGSPKLITVSKPVPDPSPITSGMIGELVGVAGEDVNFVLQTRNPHEIDEVSGDANITFKVNWVSKPKDPPVDNIDAVEIDQGTGTHQGIDNQDGTYSLRTNKFTVAAYYTLDVQMTSLYGVTLWKETCPDAGCTIVQGSPWLILIRPSEMDLAMTQVDGRGTKDAEVNPGAASSFKIIPKDRYGNGYVPSIMYAEANIGFEVILRGPQSLRVAGTLEDQCKDSGTSASVTGFGCVACAGCVKDFYVNVMYRVTLSGVYDLSVSYEKKLIGSGKPINLVFSPGKPTAKFSFVSGSALQGGPAGMVHNFTVTMRDFYGNIVSSSPQARNSQRRMQVASETSAPSVYTVPNTVSTGFDVTRQEVTTVRVEERSTPTVKTRKTITTNTVSIVTPTMVKGQATNATLIPNGDGTFKVGYVQYVSGTYDVNILVDGAHVKGSPYLATVVAAELYTPDCETSGAGLETARAGKASSFMIHSKDPYGNDVTSGGNSFTVTLQGPVFLRAKVDDCGQRPSAVDKKPGCLTQYCVVEQRTKQSNRNSNNNNKKSEIDCRNEADCCISIEQCMNENCLRSLGGLYYVEYQPMTSGKYNIHVTRSVKLKGKTMAMHVKGSPFEMEVQPGNTFAISCNAFGDGLYTAVSGVPRSFSIQARDQLGAMLRTGGDSFEVQLTSEALTIPAQIVDNKDGSYSVTYVVTRSGTYAIAVLLGIQGISDSPFTLAVQEASVEAEKCIANGPGLSTVVAGNLAGGRFRITAHDRFGNRRQTGGDQFTVVMAGRGDVQLTTAGKVTDNGDGTYDVMYILTLIGTYDLRVTEGFGSGFHIGRSKVDSGKDKIEQKQGASPFSILVTAARTDYERTLVDNIAGKLDENAADTSEDTSKGRGGSFRITAKDAFGNKKESALPEYSNVPFACSLSTKFVPVCNFANPGCSQTVVLHSVTADVKPDQDGTFMVKYASTLAGEYTIAVTYGLGFPILIQSTTVIRPAAMSIPHCYPFGEGLLGGLINSNVTFGIQTVDRFSNIIYRKSDRPIRVDLLQASNLGKSTAIKYNSNDNHANVRVTINGAKSTAEYTVVENYGEVCGEGETCTFEEPCYVCGTYTVTINVPVAATWRFSAVSRGESVGTAPGLDMLNGFSMRFVDSTAMDTISPEHSVAEIQPGVVGKLNRLIVRGKTRPSKPGIWDTLDWPKGGYQVRVEVVSMRTVERQSKGFKATTTELCTGDRSPADWIWTTVDDLDEKAEKNFVPTFQMKDNLDGTFSVDWKSMEVGEHRITVLLVDDGNPMGSGTEFPMRQAMCVRDSPFTVNVTSAEISAKNTVASGTGLSKGNAGEELQFIVDTYDAFGNARVYSSDQRSTQAQFSVELLPTAGGRKVTGVLKDLMDGTFRAVYMSSKAGMYKLHVEYGQQPIKGSPWSVKIDAGQVSTKHCTAQGPGLTIAKAGDMALFFISARDEYGNLNGQATDEVFEAKFLYLQPESESPVTPRVDYSVDYASDGRYLFAYNATVSGSYNLQVARKEQTSFAPINSDAGSAFFAITIVAGDTSGTQCVASGLGLSGGVAGMVQVLGIVARDAYSNAITQGGDKFDVHAVLMVRPAENGQNVTDGQPDNGTVVDVGDGSYQAQYQSVLDGKYQLQVKLEGVHIKGSPFNNIILNKARPPTFVSATFADTGGSIDIVFSGPTNKARMDARGPCDAVLDKRKTIDMLGNNPTCFWGSETVLTIFLGNSFLVDRGEGKIKIKEDSLMSALENSEYVIGEQGPEFPSHPPIPLVSVKAPTLVGVCQDVILDASGTTGTGGRPLFFKWGVQIGPSNASIVQANMNKGHYHEFTKLRGNCDHEDPDLRANKALPTSKGKFTIPCAECENQETGESNPMTLDECKEKCAMESKCRGFLYRASGSGHCVLKRIACLNAQEQIGSAAYFYYTLDDSKVHIPFNMLGTGESYTFVLSCQNWMGQSAIWSGVVKKMAVAIPAITLLSGSSKDFPLEFTSSSEIEVAASVTVPTCIDSFKFKYTWSLVEPVLLRGRLQLDKRTRESLSLFVPKRSMSAGADYTLQLHAAVADKPWQSNTAMAYLRVNYSPLVAVITGADRAVTTTKSLRIDAKNSYDPDQTGDPFSYLWDCSIQGSGVVSGCFDHLCIINAPCSRSNSTVTQGQMSQIMFDTTKTDLSIPANVLNAGVVYMFSVSVQKESRTPGTASIKIAAVQGEPPVVSMSTPANPTVDDYTGKVNPSERLLLSGLIKRSDGTGGITTPNPKSTKWSIIPAPTNPPPGAVNQQGSTLIIAKDTLGEGLSYTFRLAHTAAGQTGYSEITLVINKAPFAGTFSVQPMQGEEFTTFSLLASGWVDDVEDLPFMYEYRAMAHDADLKTKKMLARKASNTHKTILPSGPNTVYCYVQDKYGASTVNEVNLTVSPCLKKCIRMDELDSLQGSGDSEAALAMVSAMATQMSKGSASQRRLAEQRKSASDQKNSSCTGRTCAVVVEALRKESLGEEVTPETPLWKVLIDKTAEASLIRRLHSNLPAKSGEVVELPTQLVRRQDSGEADLSQPQFSAASLAAYIDGTKRLDVFIGVLAAVYEASNPNKERISSLAGNMAELVGAPDKIGSNVQDKTVEMYKKLVHIATETGLDDAAGPALTRVGSQLLEAADALMPPLFELPKLALTNLTDESNAIYVTYTMAVAKVVQLTQNLEDILTQLAQAQLRGKVPGEDEVLSVETNFVMQTRRVNAVDDVLKGTLELVGAPSNFFRLPAEEGILFDQQQDCALVDGVSYKMMNYRVNPLLARSSGMPAKKYMSTVASLALYGKNCETGHAQELAIAQLQEPITVGLSVPNAHNNYHDATKQASCKWFDQHGDQTWKATGCEVGAVTNGTVNCSCTHLTNFAAFLEDSFTDVVPESLDDFADIFSIAEPGSMHTVSGVGGLFVVYLCAIIWGYRRDVHIRRSERRARIKASRIQRKARMLDKSSSASVRSGMTRTTTENTATGASIVDSSMSSTMSLKGAISSAGEVTRGRSMLKAGHRRVSWTILFSSRLKHRHMVRAIISKQSNPTFSRPQQATTLLTTTLVAFVLVAFFLYTPAVDTTTVASTSMLLTQFSSARAISAGSLAAVISFPIVNVLSYLFLLTGRLKHSVIDSSKYGKSRWRPTAVYSLLWLPSILYAFAILICVSCSFLVLLYGSKMDSNGGLMWTIGCLASIFTESLIVRPIYCALEAGWTSRRPLSILS